MLKTLLEQEMEMFDERFGGEGVIAKTDENQIIIGFTKAEIKSWLTAHDERVIEACKPNVGFLRQFLNESPDWKGKQWTNEDIMRFLEI